MKVFDSPVLICFIMRGAVCLAICTGGGQPLRISGWFLKLEGGIFKQLIAHVMYCRMWERKYSLKSSYTGLVTFVSGIAMT